MQHLWKKLILEGSSTNKDMPKKFIAAAEMWASVNVVKKIFTGFEVRFRCFLYISPVDKSSQLKQCSTIHARGH